MVKKEYHSPEIEIINLTEADVICASLLFHKNDVWSDKFSQKWLDL